MDQLTVSQALEQGYDTYFHDGAGWQSLKLLQDISEEEIERGCTLATIESFYPSVPVKEDILEMIAERVLLDYYDETRCDDMSYLEESIKAIHISDDFMASLEAAVTTSSYKKDTGIKITKG